MATIELSREVPFGRIEFEQREENGRQTYRAYHVVDEAGKRIRCVSVTTFLDVLAKRALLGWYEEQGIQAALSLERAGRLKDIAIEDATSVIRENGWGAEGAMKVAQQRGVGLHTLLEKFVRDGAIPNPADHPPEHRGYVRGLIGWLLSADRHHMEVEDVEYLVADPKLRLAGRPDLRAKLDGLSYIIDLKTNRHGRVWLENHLQAPAYAHCDTVCGRDPVHGCLVVAIGPDGTFEAMPTVASAADAKAVLDVYRRMQKLNSAVDAQRERRRLREAAA